MLPICRWPEHGDAVGRNRHSHLAHVAHAGVAHGHVAGQQRADALAQAAGLDADHVREVVAHLVHHVMGHVAVHRPVAGVVGDELNHARAADGNQHGVDRCYPGVGHFAAVDLDQVGLEPMQMNRVMIHRARLPKRMRTRRRAWRRLGPSLGRLWNSLSAR